MMASITTRTQKSVSLIILMSRAVLTDLCRGRASAKAGEIDAGIWEDSEDEADEDWDGEEVYPLHYPPVMDRCEEALDPSCQDLELIDAVLVRARALCAPAGSRGRDGSLD